MRTELTFRTSLCPHHHPATDPRTGELWCPDCALVLDPSPIDATISLSLASTHCPLPLLTDRISRTNRDSEGRRVREFPTYLRRLDRHTIPSAVRHDREEFLPAIERACVLLGVNGPIPARARAIAEESRRRGLNAGRELADLTVAWVILAAREGRHLIGMSYAEAATKTGRPRAKIQNACRVIEIGLSLHVPKPTASDFLRDPALRSEFSPSALASAQTLIEAWGRATNGGGGSQPSPRVLAATSLYRAGRTLNPGKEAAGGTTQERVARRFGVTVVSLRNTMARMAELRVEAG